MSGPEARDEHDPALSALYARLPREEPPAALDAVILDAARAATAQPMADSPRRGARLALAATLLLSTSVLLMHEYRPAPRVSDAIIAADQVVAARTPAPEPPRAERVLKAARSELAEANAVSPAAPPAAAAIKDRVPAEVATSEASPATDAGMDDVAGLIEREVLAGLDARLTRAESGPLRWRLQSEASPEGLADRLQERLRNAGFAAIAACPGVRWSGERAGWRAELRESPRGVDLRVVPAGPPCG